MTGVGLIEICSMQLGRRCPFRCLQSSESPESEVCSPVSWVLTADFVIFIPVTQCIEKVRCWAHHRSRKNISIDPANQKLSKRKHARQRAFSHQGSVPKTIEFLFFGISVLFFFHLQTFSKVWGSIIWRSRFRYITDNVCGSQRVGIPVMIVLWGSRCLILLLAFITTTKAVHSD